MAFFSTDVYFVQFHCNCFQSIQKQSLQREQEKFYVIDLRYNNLWASNTPAACVNEIKKKLNSTLQSWLYFVPFNLVHKWNRSLCKNIAVTYSILFCPVINDTFPKFYLIVLFIKIVIFSTDVYFVQFHCNCFQSIQKQSLQREQEKFYESTR
jgi:hypothetical protein